jgi:threonine dehydrogenase-like Zn-dependent dehydrogenase
MRLAALAGARVIAMDINPLRLENCRSTAGVTHVVDAGRTDTEARIRELTDGRMPDVVIDATGNLAAIRDAFRYLAHAGRYVLVGLQKGEIGFSHPEFHRREATLLSSRNATPEDFRQVLGHLHDGTVDVTAFITHHATLEDVVDRFPEWMSPASGVVKAMVHL